MDNAEGWTRHAVKDIPVLKEVLEATQTVLNEYMNTAKKLTGNEDLIFVGYLTGTGKKSKDLEGLEDMYQWDRDPNDKPRYLKQAREYLLTTHDWIKMCPLPFEADAILMSRTEKKGRKGMAMFIDKDLRAVEGCWFVDMNPIPAERQLIFSENEVGALYLKVSTTSSGKKKTEVKGFGFIWDWILGVGGDKADDYKGLAGMGAKKVYDLIHECETKKEIAETIYELYKKKFPNGKIYTPQHYPDDRPQKEQFRTAYQLLEQHMNLAHQERSPKDLFRLSDYIGEEADEVHNND